MKIFKSLLPILIIILFLTPVLGYENVTTYFGKITKILNEEEVPNEDNGPSYYSQLLEVALQSDTGPLLIEVQNGDEFELKNIRYKIGDQVIIKSYQDIEGTLYYRISEFDRTQPLIIITLLFIIIALIIAKKKALYSLLSLAISFIVIFSLILPMIINGRDPLSAVMLSSLILLPTMFYLSHGFSKKTTIAMLATLITILITGILTNLFIDYAQLHGFLSEEAYFLKDQIENFNLQNLLLAGMLISVLGVLDDITISQVSIVSELHSLDPKITFQNLYLKGMNIGKDHIASMINTLVLVYAGTSLPLLLLFINNPLPIPEIFSFEVIATEIVRTLIGSMGLIIAVPFTTFIAAYTYTKKMKI